MKISIILYTEWQKTQEYFCPSFPISSKSVHAEGTDVFVKQSQLGIKTPVENSC
jgi:hypothetical protein